MTNLLFLALCGLQRKLTLFGGGRVLEVNVVSRPAPPAREGWIKVAIGYRIA